MIRKVFVSHSFNVPGNAYFVQFHTGEKNEKYNPILVVYDRYDESYKEKFTVPIGTGSLRDINYEGQQVYNPKSDTMLYREGKMVIELMDKEMRKVIEIESNGSDINVTSKYVVPLPDLEQEVRKWQ